MLECHVLLVNLSQDRLTCGGFEDLEKPLRTLRVYISDPNSHEVLIFNDTRFCKGPINTPREGSSWVREPQVPDPSKSGCQASSEDIAHHTVWPTPSDRSVHSSGPRPSLRDQLQTYQRSGNTASITNHPLHRRRIATGEATLHHEAEPDFIVATGCSAEHHAVDQTHVRANACIAVGVGKSRAARRDRVLQSPELCPESI
eukprot:scaffold68147_cov44-Cyclotella_meneghiniana.AAC.2